MSPRPFQKLKNPIVGKYFKMIKNKTNTLEAESKVRLHKVPLDFPCDQRFVSDDHNCVK